MAASTQNSKSGDSDPKSKSKSPLQNNSESSAPGRSRNAYSGDNFKLFLISFLIAVVGLLIAKFAFKFDFGGEPSASKQPLGPKLYKDRPKNPEAGTDETWRPPKDNGVFLTKEELATFDGSNDYGDIYVAVIGEVYDVSTGEYYKPGGGYHFFAAKDGSRGFSTGSAKDSSDSINDLQDGEVAGVVGWAMFYRTHENYTYVGKLIGTYYDEEGNPTQAQKNAIAKYEANRALQKRMEKDREDFPNCNKYWNKDEGSQAWCKDSLLKNRIATSTLVPRKRINPINNKEACVCVEYEVAREDKVTYKLYPNCEDTATQCRAD
mmetsp:Transcript_30822/g.38046  ORF Transcript_30822/g.38046 Transcript_30822/m.38046 type:complete len:321 (-) Transcript_30822:356-1318(-)|eukprot:CAMPEP_0204838000 /NCGR_PEP_ID=MMETSP1346-20131115/29528_1 /ASSEMBLY_ACC=CAM_ASM_000771 /TAXON_ID=215587 /ORGANISM="Aplanochytrium stocchinoi, Strain GSBS06" /LENGTH=320 /DNA_ID=CAMNT_0051973767 /DNA_START=181 /DNA_END=1146 /DNA_ORIENTATION=+